MIGLSKEKRTLFGGALRCAGLAAAATLSSSAMADFTPAAAQYVPNYTFGYAFGNYGNQLFLDSDASYSAIFPTATSYAGPGGALNAYVGATAMGVSATIGDNTVWGYAGAAIWQYFTVDNTKQVQLDWDLASSNVYAQAYLFSFTDGILADYGYGTAGSMTFTLNPGTLYAFIARASVNTTSGLGDVYVTLTNVPAPGALAMLGVGMIGMRRRRRT